MKQSILFAFLFFSLQAFSQTGTVKGQVTDANSGLAMGLASVQVFKEGVKEPVGGGLTKENGKFEFKLPYGNLNIVIEFFDNACILKIQ